MKRTEIEFLQREQIVDNVVVIKINKSYRPGMSPEELYDVTRGCWRRRIDSVARAEYALAVAEGIVIEVYRIFAWYSALDEVRETVPFDPEIEKGRIIFKGEVAEERVREKYVGKSVSKLYKRGEADPVKTFYKDNR